jgi:hypothetical protein
LVWASSNMATFTKNRTFLNWPISLYFKPQTNHQTF